MMLRYEPPATYFLHIPKTAGIAFGNRLGAAYAGLDRLYLAPPSLAHLTVAQAHSFRHYHSAHAQELFEQQWARYQARPRRTYSIAPRLRRTLHRAESGLKDSLRRTWPGLAEGVRHVRAGCQGRRKYKDGQT